MINLRNNNIMRLLKHILLLVMSLFIFNKSQAQQQYASISDFTISSPFINNSGHVIINNGTTTEVKFRVNFSRYLAAEGNWNWKNTDITVGLGSYDSGGILITFDGITRVTNADFEQYKGFLEKEFIAKIDNSKLVVGKKIVLVVKPTPSTIFEPYLSRNFDFVFTRPELSEVTIWNKISAPSANVYRLSINGKPDGPYIDYFTPFFAYKKPAAGAVPIYEFTGPEFYDYNYSYDQKIGKNGSKSSIIFYAFKDQVPGTVPVYVYTHIQDNTGLGYAYTTRNISEEQWPGWGNKLIAFYVYPTK